MNDKLEKWDVLAQKEMQYSETEGLSSSKYLWTSSDLEKMELEETLPGFFPYTRGVRATMYKGRPWTIRQYSGFSSAVDSNRFYLDNLKAGQKGLSVAFDLATHRGYDSDNDKVIGDVGKAGVAIDSVEDMKLLFDNIPLDKVSVSMTISGAVLPVMASFIVAAEEQGVKREDLIGTIQNDILKEFMVRNAYIYPPEFSIRVAGDVMEYISKYMPRYNSVSISGYHMQEAGATIIQELAFALANGLEYVNEALSRGMNIDDFAPRFSFFFGSGMNFYMEIAKLRAARTLWANLIKKFNPKNEKSMMLRTHSQTSGWSLAEQDPYNNIVRTTIEAMSAIFGGTQSLHTNAFDESLALPTELSARVARNTQLILEHETGIKDAIDPFAGSYMMESLTNSIIVDVTKLLNEIDKFGGMTKYINAGIPNKVISEAAIRRQALIDSGAEVIIGVNKYQPKNEEHIKIREIDNIELIKQQVKNIENIKNNRDNNKVYRQLERLKEKSKDRSENLLEIVVDAMRLRATVGEVSDAIATSAGRYKNSKIDIPNNIYSSYYEDKEHITEIITKIGRVTKKLNKHPKILITKIGQDGHDRGANVVSSAFKDFGFEVISGQLFSTPKDIVELAVANDCDIIGVSSLAGGHKVLVYEVMKLLEDTKIKDIIVVVGGVVPPTEYEYLKTIGVSCVFGPGTSLVKAAYKLLRVLEESNS